MWIDDIPAIDTADYQRLQDRWFDHLARTDGVLAHGSFGSVGAPGLSDLDLVAVVDDAALARGAFRLLDLDQQESRIMVHPPLVIPHSLYADLPLYHPVTIRWHHGGEAFAPTVTTPVVGLLHVLEKTLYVQGRLLRAGAGDRSRRRLFLMLTSLARSVEWTERSGQTPTAEETRYAEAVLQMRSRWLASPDARNDLQPALDALHEQARTLAVTLPERLAAALLVEAPAAPPSARTMQIRPLQFVRHVAGDLAAAVARYPRPRSGWHGRLDGELRLAGPALFRLLLARCATERAVGAIYWPLLVGAPAADSALTSLSPAVRDALVSYTRANDRYAHALGAAGLSAAYFGTLWSATGWRRHAYRLLAAGPGRRSPLVVG